MAHKISMPKWSKSPFSAEQDEFQRVSKDKHIPLPLLRQKYQTSTTVKLTDTIWRVLDNTESFRTMSENQMRTLMRTYKRDVDAVLAEFHKGVVRCPIVLRTGAPGKYHYHLVAGNTRLCIARFVKLQPTVQLVSIPLAAMPVKAVNHKGARR